MSTRSHPGAGSAWLPFVAATVFTSAVVGVALGHQPMYALAAVVAVGAALLLLLRPAVAVYLLPSIPVLSGLGRGVPIPGFRLSEVLAAGIGFVVIARGRGEQRRRAPSWRLLDWTTAVYTFVAVVVPTADITVLGHNSAGGVSLDLVGPVQYLIFYRAAVVCLDTPERRRRAVQVLLLTSVITNIAAVLQAMNLPGVRSTIVNLIKVNPYYTAGYVSVPRATGLFPHWHVLAGYDAAMVLIVLAYMLRGVYLLPRTLLLVVGGFAVAGIGVSVTATDALGVVVGAVIIGVMTKRLRALAVWSTPAIVAAGVIFWPEVHKRLIAQGLTGGGSSSSTPQSVGFRTQVWTQQYLPAIRHDLLLGYGPNLPASITWPYPENVYLSLLVRGGVVLMAGYVLWMAALLCRSWSVARRPGENQAMATAFFALLVALAFMQMLFPYLTSDGLPMVVAFLAALTRLDQELPAAGPRMNVAWEGRISRQEEPPRPEFPILVNTSPGMLVG